MLEEVTTPGLTQRVTADLSKKEVCPNCGEFVDTLDKETGWCFVCSPQFCNKCGNEFKERQARKICSTCRSQEWIADNADAIEVYTAQGYSFTQARVKVLEQRRAICHCCHKPIKGGRQGVHIFCRTSVRCRKAKRRFRTLRERYPREIALQFVVQELLREGNNE
jgi:predicted Zn-ribbon and HTH transcriptional regulator